LAPFNAANSFRFGYAFQVRIQLDLATSIPFTRTSSGPPYLSWPVGKIAASGQSVPDVGGLDRTLQQPFNVAKSRRSADFSHAAQFMAQWPEQDESQFV
jgi:hypothetical protein